MQIPLRMVADIRVVEGPSMIKSENGRLRSYVTLNVRDRDIIGFVNEAREAVKPIEASLAGTGMSRRSGNSRTRCACGRRWWSFPMVLALILFLLYMTFHDMFEHCWCCWPSSGPWRGR
jgi:Cu(I)/Ag(I) efflux system membrane protein CusA/SilA